MAEFEVAGERWRTRPMTCFGQWNLYRRLDKILPALEGAHAALFFADVLGRSRFTKMLMPLVAASDEDFKAATALCLGHCDVFQKDSWVGVTSSNLSMAVLIAIIMEVVGENLSAVFAFQRSTFKHTPIDLEYEPVGMENGMDWLVRPWLRGKCSWEAMASGALSLLDITTMNDALNVADENEIRARKAAEKAAERKR